MKEEEEHQRRVQQIKAEVAERDAEDLKAIEAKQDWDYSWSDWSRQKKKKKKKAAFIDHTTELHSILSQPKGRQTLCRRH